MKKTSSRASLVAATISVFVSLLLLAGMFGNTLAVASMANTRAGTSLTTLTSLNDHVPIRADSDSEFISLAASEDWHGDGSFASPYVIENLEINATGSFDGIYVGNLTVCFIIANCSVYGAICADSGGYPYEYGAGIAAVNDTGFVVIRNNLCDGNSEGIFIYGLSSFTVDRNTCNNNDYDGINLYACVQGQIEENICSVNANIWLVFKTMRAPSCAAFAWSLRPIPICWPGKSIG